MSAPITTATATPDTPWLKKLGPGLITGAADDDPSGIATYSQAGAQFGFNMLWTVLFTFPLMAAIQVVSARIGRAGRVRNVVSATGMHLRSLALSKARPNGPPDQRRSKFQSAAEDAGGWTARKNHCDPIVSASLDAQREAITTR